MQRDGLHPTTSGWSAPAGAEAKPAPDRVLLERIAAGEKEALTALFARHRPRLYDLALRILSDPVEAAEVVESVAQDVRYETRHFSPTQYPVHRWLTDVTRMAALDHRRAHTSSPTA